MIDYQALSNAVREEGVSCGTWADIAETFERGGLWFHAAQAWLRAERAALGINRSERYHSSAARAFRHGTFLSTRIKRTIVWDKFGYFKEETNVVTVRTAMTQWKYSSGGSEDEALATFHDLFRGVKGLVVYREVRPIGALYTVTFTLLDEAVVAL